MTVTPEKNKAMTSSVGTAVSGVNDFRTDRQYEDDHLQMTMDVIRTNSAGYDSDVHKLRSDIIQMTEQFREGDTEIWVPLNNTIALYETAYASYKRSERAAKKPYFGRIIFTEKSDGTEKRDGRAGEQESLYIGRSGVSRSATEQVVIDWRAPISNVYYENGLGECSFRAPDGKPVVLDLSMKRTFDIEEGQLTGYFDSSVAANDELLNKYLARNKQAVLSEIVATIQKEQNDIIRRSPFKNVIVQGAAGSGKTTVAMHRISYILYNFPDDIKPSDFYIIGSNEMLLNYITGVLPELDVEGFRQMTMEQMFVRLLYEDWDAYHYGLRLIDPGDPTAALRGTTAWYSELEGFCADYEREYFLSRVGRTATAAELSKDPARTEARESIYRDIILDPMCFVEGIENGKVGVYDRSDRGTTDPDRQPVCLMKGAYIERFLAENPTMSLQNKILTLNERFNDNLEQELLLKDIKYTAKEKKAVRSAFREYFGPTRDKKNIYDIYREFIRRAQLLHPELRLTAGVRMKACEAMNSAGRRAGRSEGEVAEFRKNINVGQGFFSSENMSERLRENERKAAEAENRSITGLDVYEMAALAYIYKQIREVEVITEAHHIVIDEAQDYGMMAYRVLNRCLRECKYTIMGDISQNIRYDSGINDWSELRELLLTDRHDSFCTLRKSYRNTIEISDFATGILDHGSFEVYPVEPIIRHGAAPAVRSVGAKRMITEITDICRKWQSEGLSTIAIVCRTAAQAAELRAKLEGRLELVDTTSDTAEFGNGVMVLSVDMTKGLEFDSVLIYEPTAANYPEDDRNVKLLYVAATRALHELTLLYAEGEELTELISKPAPEGMSRRVVSDAGETAADADALPEDTRYSAEDEERYVKDKILSTATSRTKEILGDKTTFKDGRWTAPKPTKAVPRRVEQRSEDIPVQTAGFATAISESELTPSGHAANSHMIKWVSKQADGIFFQSRYGVLRVYPISAGIARISFSKGMSFALHEEHRVQRFSMLKSYTYRERGSISEICCGRLTICVDRGTGAISYRDEKNRELLKETPKEPRFIDDGRSYTYYTVNANDAFYAYPGRRELVLKYVRNAAFDVTPDNGSPAYIMSRDRFGILVDAKGKTRFCHIPGYGTFTEVDGNETDMYFVTASGDEELLRFYDKLTGSSTTTTDDTGRK